MFIVGIDPSLSSTGVCVYDHESQQTYAAQIDGHYKDCHLGERCRRIAAAVNNEITQSRIVDACDSINVFIENPAGPLRGYAQDLPVLYWAIIMELEHEEFLYPTIWPVSSGTLKKFICGRGNAKPEDKVVAILSKLRHMIPGEYVVSPESKGGMMACKDMYDSIGLAALGECVLNPEKFTKQQQECVKKIVPL